MDWLGGGKVEPLSILIPARSRFGFVWLDELFGEQLLVVTDYVTMCSLYDHEGKKLESPRQAICEGKKNLNEFWFA